MTNPAPAPRPDLRQRIAEMFPCICIPPFEDGAHWHDCPTGFRKEVEELVAEETAALRAQLFDSQDYIAVGNRKIEAVYGQQTSVGKVLEDLAEARRERDEAREKLARAKNAGACDVLLQIRSKLNEEQRSGRYRPVSEEMRDWLGNLDHEYKKALGAESPRKEATEGQ